MSELWSTDPGVLNLFSINIAASGSGKSGARNKLIAEPLDYMRDTNFDITFPDFEVSKFTRAGIILEIFSLYMFHLCILHIYSKFTFIICIPHTY